MYDVYFGAHGFKSVSPESKFRERHFATVGVVFGLFHGRPFLALILKESRDHRVTAPA